jgi:four helix bundle protein
VQLPEFMPAEPSDYLEHERLDVYRAALEFLPLAIALVPRQGERAVLDQLERAAQSIVLNIAEGAGRHASGDKRRAYEIAKGSALECAAILDVLRVRGIGTPERHAEARALIVRIAKMLSRLCGVRGRGDRRAEAADDRRTFASRRTGHGQREGPTGHGPGDSGHGNGRGEGNGKGNGNGD